MVVNRKAVDWVPDSGETKLIRTSENGAVDSVKEPVRRAAPKYGAC